MSAQAAAKPPSPTPRKDNPDFVDITDITDAYGIHIIISQRTDSGRLTFGVFRRYVREDVLKRTSFIPESMLDKLLEALAIAKQTMDKIRAEGHPKLVKPVPPLPTTATAT